MTQILRRSPYSDQRTEISVADETLLVRPHQIVVWVSVTSLDSACNDRTPRLPAILDTGHSHNFSIQEDHLDRWGGITSESLPVFGAMRSQDRRIALRLANVWLHPNLPGARDALVESPLRLEMPAGIAVYPGGSGFPRLPLLGLRAISANRIVLTIDGERREVSAHRRRWRLW